MRHILEHALTIAVVGASPRPERPSNRIAGYLVLQGYNMIPVNPTVDEVLGKTSYPDLLSIPEPVDIVDIFRRSEYVPPIVDQAIEIGAKAVWMQSGVMHAEAAQKAEEAGLLVVMNRCIMVEHLRLEIAARTTSE
jgi:predicted CoA-binding protein